MKILGSKLRSTYIKKVFGDPLSSGGDGCAPLVKSEPVFQSDHQEDVHYTSGYRSWRGRRRGRGRSSTTSPGYKQEVSNPGNGANPVDKDGRLFNNMQKIGLT